MKTLCLDLGTKTGWALFDGDRMEDSGTLELADDKELAEQRKTGGERRSDIRCSRLFSQVQFLISKPDRVVFEDVQFSSTQMQSQLWASLRASVWFAFPEAEFQCVPVGTLKAFATGYGNADKEEMRAVLEEVSPALDLPVNFGEADDNEIDAIWLGIYNLAAGLGEVDYLSVYSRKRAAKAERKAKEKAKRLATKQKLTGASRVKSVRPNGG